MTRDDAETLYGLLRSLCLVGPSHTLHIGGHVIKPIEPLPRTPKAPKKAKEP